MRARLIALYAQLAAHTEGECSGACVRPRTCCDERYCLIAIEFAKSHWQVELAPTWHPALPLMGDDGCTAAAHLRPICTAHTCEICAHGEKRGDAVWTARYLDLMQAIGELELCAFESAA
ncbi:MAG: hypothetical protein ABL996_02090 [Micropepsaceae bacterium]